jgi:signal transduction histidine kinase
MLRSPRTLRGRLALWSCAATLAALAVFSLAAYIVVYLDEREEAATGKPTDPEDPAGEAREKVLVALAVAVPCGILLSLAAAAVVSRRAIAPIDRAVRTAAQISVDRFDRRMDVPEAGHELRPLADAINELLGRLQRGYDALAAFSADASHELRTPLTAVCTELEVGLRRPRSAEDWEHSAKTALDELRRLSGIVDAMLRFAQADATRSSEARDIDLAEVVAEVGAIHADAAARGGVKLFTELGDAHVHVRGDGDLLATALANLVGNALRLTPKAGEVRLSIDAEPEAVTVHVDDTGPGLPGDRTALFVPFALRGTPGAGVGLGLPIARRIVARYGGTITADDRAGGGARFSIRLPRTAT